MLKLIKEERGEATMVEATLMLPFCMIMIIGMLYAALYLCQKANVQANLETALIYYKNVESDTYVSAKSQMDYGGTGVDAVGSNFDERLTYQNPYRFFFMSFKQTEFADFFKDMCGHMFFTQKDWGNIEVTAKRKNFVFYKTIEATAKQTIKPPVKLTWVCGPEAMTISVSGKVVINDGDDFIRNMDLAIDVLADTKLGAAARNLGAKARELYEKFKNIIT